MALAITDRRILPQTFSDMGQVASLKRARSTWFLLACIFGFGFLAAAGALAIGVGLYTDARADNARLAGLQQQAEAEVGEYRAISDVRGDIRQSRELLFNDINASRANTRDRLWQKAQAAWREARPTQGDTLQLPGQTPLAAWQETHPTPGAALPAGQTPWESQTWANASRDASAVLQAESTALTRARDAVNNQQAIDDATRPDHRPSCPESRSNIRRPPDRARRIG